MSGNLNVRTRIEGDLAVVVTDGYINNTAAESIAEACTSLLDDGIRRFVMNLEGSRIVNSIGVSILIEVIEQIRAVDGRLAFSNATPTIEKTFRIMGLLQTTSVHGTEAEAISSIR